MLKGFKIINFMGLENIEVKEFKNNFNLIYGENASGKTRLLKFLSFMTGDIEFNIDSNEKIHWIGSITIEIDDVIYTVEKKVKSIENELEIEDNFYETDIVIFKNSKKKYHFNFIENKISRWPIQINLFKQKSKNKVDWTEDEDMAIHIERKISDMFYFSLNEINNEDFKYSNVKIYGNKYQEKELKIMTEEDKKITNFLKSIDSGIIQFERKPIFESSGDNGFNWYQVETRINMKVDNSNSMWININSDKLSTGIKRSLKIYFILKELIESENKIYVIDELDPYIHDFLFKSYIKLFKKYSQWNQIFMVTHNSSILNDVILDNLMFLTKDDNDNSKLVYDQIEEQDTVVDIFEKYFKNAWVKKNINSQLLEDILTDE